ncbi:isocitrate/isopropylmalate family dehydrogenase [Tuwongella immobilis]|uniref:Isopropylmalate dehydrogenase-like domain-containing protein n=1 Tax=Tuwongella immobilis TaxID=692036 RepID=A0A6C2YJM2_9BACT|nr:isocitrate/isopropylmalate family dehydrogenase [Tuwongella immobilis]VIP01162.1 isocitrate dehydrogenase : Uncharacterized protein OS=uncultured bacterium GN=ACD_73C00724G0002 PE=3 SV=1: Iso_dh [Tuwongella immobilis]VTR97750.1 isocitrate dehydrogenase : Uncharacterized protein OS=uncultured bacterium GN=ACD_73C00724G0002 PE=3 SV=1: Iso_dh [Tuwongella immobilis]
MSQRIVFLQGGGIGLEQEQSLRHLLTVLGVKLEFQVIRAGRYAVEHGEPAISPEVISAIRETGIALKTKLFSPVPKGKEMPVNVNAQLRKALGLFASVRPIHNLAGLPSRFSGLNFVLVREITEDLYAASEHEIVPGVVQSFKIVTEAACLRFFRFTCELTRAMGRKTVHCIHKANILKLADGLFLDCFRRVIAEYPDLVGKDMIVDNGCMQMVSRPHQFDVVAAGNLYGDLLSDLGAGLVGGISCTASVNYGENVKVYEAIFGASHDQVPPGRANPLPLLMPAIELLRDLGYTDPATRLLTAIETVLQAGQVRTRDLGGSASTTDFTEAIARELM